MRRDRQRGVFDGHADGRQNVARMTGDLVQAAQDDHALDAVLAGYGVGDGVGVRGRRSGLLRIRQAGGTQGHRTGQARYRAIPPNGHLPPVLP